MDDQSPDLPPRPASLVPAAPARSPFGPSDEAAAVNFLAATLPPVLLGMADDLARILALPEPRRSRAIRAACDTLAEGVQKLAALPAVAAIFHEWRDELRDLL